MAKRENGKSFTVRQQFVIFGIPPPSTDGPPSSEARDTSISLRLINHAIDECHYRNPTPTSLPTFSPGTERSRCP